jgi:hypothetical protein
MALVEPKKTYRAAGSLVCAAGTLPFLTIAGVAGRVVRVTKILINSPVLTAAQLLRVAITKHSTAFTGGTSTPPTKVPLDTQGSSAALATVLAYTAGPTGGGALIGSLTERNVIAQSTTLAPAAALDEGDFNFMNGELSTQYPTLRTSSEVLAVGFPVAPASAVTISYMLEWTEDGN